MSAHRPLVIALTLLVISAVSEGADLTGRLLYDGVPVSEIFPDITTVSATAYPSEPGDQVEGTVDLSTSTYNFVGLEAGTYGVTFYLDRTPPTTSVGDEGDLRSYQNIEITDSPGVFDEDFDVLYNYWVVSPIDSKMPLDGLGHDCTMHPTVAYPITFAIEAVPRAVNYVFNAGLEECPGFNLDWIVTESTEPSVEVPWGTADEDYQNLYISCTGASGRPLCSGPTFEYDDYHVWALLLRNGENTGRGSHRTDAVVVPAVASASGAQGTHWTSAVSVTNLMTTDRTIDVVYTPRGVNGLTTYQETSIALSASSQLSWSDVMDELFSVAGAGALEFRGHQLAVTSRTSTPGAVEGSYGQGIPPIQPEQVLRVGATDSASMGGVEEGETFRTNLGLVEVWGENATVRITVFDSAMHELGFRDQQLRPYENTQINQVVKTITGADSLSEGVVKVAVTSGNGRVGAYLSVVDNATGDPTFIAIAPQAPAGG